jgi:hypothetical protein
MARFHVIGQVFPDAHCRHVRRGAPATRDQGAATGDFIQAAKSTARAQRSLRRAGGEPGGGQPGARGRHRLLHNIGTEGENIWRMNRWRPRTVERGPDPRGQEDGGGHKERVDDRG